MTIATTMHTPMHHTNTSQAPMGAPAVPVGAAGSGLAMLLSLQHGDSFFPSGAMAFSWGLESLMRDGLVVDAEGLAGFIEAQVLQRWLSLDQGIVSAAWQLAQRHAEAAGLLQARTDAAQDAAPGDAASLCTALLTLDQLVEAMTLPSSLREGSRRLGRTLLQVHAKLGTPAATQLQAHVTATAQAAVPHLAVVQGYLWQGLGMNEMEARAVSAHSVCVSASSAAVRLGLVGHLDAQRVLMRMQPLIAEALAQPAPAFDAWASSVIATDIAAMRHGLHDARMFAN